MRRYPQYMMSLFLIGLLTSVAYAQDWDVKDTVYYGDNGVAYALGNGQFYVPIYVTTDQEWRGISFGMEYGLGYLSPTVDSVSVLGSIFMQGNYLDLTNGLMFGTEEVDGVMPDTCCVSGHALMEQLPEGSYLLCSIWFTGGYAGDSFVVDSSFYTSDGFFGEFLAYPKNFDEYVPQFVGGSLSLVVSPISILPPASTSGSTGTPIEFEINFWGGIAPFEVTVDSMVHKHLGAVMTEPPTVSGSNPFTVTWTPAHEQYGDWTVHFTVSDASSNTSGATVDLSVTYAGPECGLHHGDANYDCVVDIDDAVYLINYIFNGGPAPGSI